MKIIRKALAMIGAYYAHLTVRSPFARSACR